MSDLPNPGSPEAHERGCVCPRMDNANGRGYMGGVVGQDGTAGRTTKMIDRNDAPVGWAKVREAAEATIIPPSHWSHQVDLAAANTRFRQVANPSTVLAILDERDALVKELADEKAISFAVGEQIADMNTEMLKVEAARDRAIRALQRMVDEHISTNKDRDAWRCWSNACDGDHLAPTREAIVHRPGCPVPDAEALLREAEE